MLERVVETTSHFQPASFCAFYCQNTYGAYNKRVSLNQVHKRRGRQMTDTPLTPQEWNEKLQITNGKEIEEALRPFHEKGAVLTPPTEDLDKKVSDAWINLTEKPPAQITVLSLQETGKIVVQLPDLFQLALARGLEAHLIVEDVYDIFEHHFRGQKNILSYREANERMRRALKEDLQGFWEAPYSGILARVSTPVQEVIERMRRAFRDTLLFHVLSLAAGERENLMKVAPFTELLLLGNVMVGETTPRGRILVVTA